MDFINREVELAMLDKLYRSPGFQFVPIYGRRRIGKTRLVREFMAGKKAIYFLADSIPDSEQLKWLGRAVGEYFSDTILADAGFKNWYQFFAYLRDKHAGRLVLVVDEFPYLVNANQAISSIFLKGVEEYLKETDLFMILLGSSIGMMEKEVLFYQAPLYGRRTASLEVKEMGFEVLTGFFPHRTFEDLVRIYSIFGTVPAYLEKVDQSKDILKTVRDAILDPGTFFYNEVEYILREELREPRNYFVILRAIAQGKRKLSEIINDTGFEKSLVSKYLDILRQLRFVDKEIPVTEKIPEKSRQGIYRLHDRFFAFWFKYVFPNRSRIELGNPEYVLRIIADSLEQHASLAYEDACKDLCRKLAREGVIGYTMIGRWWTKDAEIDVVALDEEASTAWFGECKWSARKAGEDVYEGLVRKSKLVDWRNGTRTERYMLFSKSGFAEGLIRRARAENVILVKEDRVMA